MKAAFIAASAFLGAGLTLVVWRKFCKGKSSTSRLQSAQSKGSISALTIEHLTVGDEFDSCNNRVFCVPMTCLLSVEFLRIYYCINAL